MEVFERTISHYDWITLVIAFCLLLLATVKWIYGKEFIFLLSAAVSDRYIKVSRHDSTTNGLRFITVLAYTINLSLWVSKIVTIETNISLEIKNFVMILTGIAFFILAKRYLSMMIASLLKFDEILELIEYHRNTYRAVLGIYLLIINLIIFYIFPESQEFIRAITIISILIFIAYNFIILFTYSKGLVKHSFYFILYLCTLEIAPYLLLYKYFMLLRAY